MDQRLRNWGLAVRGGLPGALPPDATAQDPDELDALVIEAAMVVCRRERPRPYSIMKYIYVRGRSDIEAANFFRTDEESVQKVTLTGVRWVINYLRR